MAQADISGTHAPIDIPKPPAGNPLKAVVSHVRRNSALRTCLATRNNYRRGVLLRFVRIIATGVCSGLLCGPALANSAASLHSAWVAREWQLDDGLPDNNITGVVQTPEGYLWLGTHRGLVRFDGVRFQRVPLPGRQQMTFGLIRGLSLLRTNELWLTMEGGVVACLKPGRTNVFTKDDGVSKFRPKAAVEGAQDTATWIGYSDGWAYRIADGRVKRFSGEAGLVGSGYCQLATDINGQLWFAKIGHVGAFQQGRFVPLLRLENKPLCIGPARKGGVWICVGARLLKYNGGAAPQSLAELAPASATLQPTVLFEDHHSALWLGTFAHGLFRFDGTNVARVQTSHGNILSLAEDNEGNIWVGTGGGGLNRLRPRVLELESRNTGLPFESVRSVCEDSTGRLWVVGQTGGLARQDKGIWKTLSSEDGWPGVPAMCVTSDPEGTIWIGTYHGGLFRWQDGRFTQLDRPDGLASDKVNALLVDRERNLWIALETPACVQRWHKGQFLTYTQPQNEFPIRAMAEDAAGTIWMAASDGLLLRVSGNALVDETRHTLWPPVTIRCLQATPDGSLWIGYAGAGVGRLRNGSFALIGEEQGLLDSYVGNVASDDYGALWFATDRGIFKVRQKELDALAEGRAQRVLSVAYGRDQALPNLQANYGFFPGAVRTRNGRLCFSLSTGLAIVHPERMQPNAVAPPVLVERMAVDGQNLGLVGAGREPSLPAGHRKVELEFTALSFVAPENIRFRYRLEGWDENWQETQQQRSVSYTRLPAGQYLFQVTACNEAGVWSEPGAELRFRVQPFLWQTWWFRALVLATLAGLVAAAVRRHERGKHRLALERLERQALMERERARVAQDLHDDLGSGLTEIGLMASLAQRQNLPVERVRQHLRQVTDKSREMVTALDEIVWAINPRHDSVTSLSHYLCEYAQSFLELTPIRCRLEVARDLPARALNSDQRHNLFLAFKEALTNVVRHSQAAEARITISTDAHALTVVVADNGQGMSDTTTGQGADGLTNMRRRLEQIGGRCEFHSAPGQGTRVRFVLPLPEVGQS